MQKQWKATTAGILSIIAGTWGVMAGVILTVITSAYPPAWILLTPFQTVILNRLCPVAAALGLVAILGGVLAVRRRRWGLALAGAICAAMIPPPFFLGALAVILVAVGRDEFEKPEEPAPPTPSVDEGSE